MKLFNTIKHCKVNNKRKSKLLLRFVVSYIIILIIPLVFTGVLIFNHYSKALKSEVQNVTLMALKQVIDAVELRVQEVKYLGIQLPKNEQIMTMLYAKSKDDLSEYDFIKLIDELKKWRSSNAFVRNIYIYFPQTHTVVGADGKYDFSTFYNYVYRYKGMYEDDLKLMLDNTSEPMIKPSDEVYAGNDRDQLISYFVPIRNWNKPNKAVAIITIDASSITKIIQNILGKYKGNAYILDDEGNNILSLLDPNIMFDSSKVSTLLKNTQEVEYIKDKNDKKVMALGTLSESTALKCIAILPSNLILEKVNFMRVLSIILILISVIIASILAYYFSYGNYYPIKNITDQLLLNQNSSESFNKYFCKNEYDIINKVLKDMIYNNKTTQQKLNQYMPIIEANFLNKLLRCDFNSLDAIKSMTNFMGIDLHGPFTVLIFSVDEYSEFTKRNSEPIHGIFNFFVQDMVKELFKTVGQGFSVEIDDGKIATIIDSSKIPNTSIEEIKLLCNRIMQAFEENFHFTLTVGIGERYDSVMDISKSCIEARTALDFRIIKGKNTIISFNKNVEDDGFNVYFQDSDNIIINCLKAGDYEHVSRIMQEIYNNIQDRPVSIGMARYVFYHMINTTLKTMTELDRNLCSKTISQKDFSYSLVKCETLSEVFELTMNFYKIVCSSVNESREGTYLNLCNEVIKYVDENYQDKNLSLNFLSEKFNIGSPNLSRLFKKHTQYNFVDYIHNIRLKKAKEILANTQKTVSQIADEVGYLESHSMIRAFRKYEGITPGQFRDNVI
jgi:two-component system, response regulator YesN